MASALTWYDPKAASRPPPPPDAASAQMSKASASAAPKLDAARPTATRPATAAVIPEATRLKVDAPQARGSKRQPTGAAAVPAPATASQLRLSQPGSGEGWDLDDCLEEAAATPSSVSSALPTAPASAAATLPEVSSAAAAAVPAESATVGPSDAAPVQTRTLDVTEVGRSVDAAVAAKEALARSSITKAKQELLAKKKAMEVRQKEEEREMLQAAQQLAALEGELQNGVSRSSQQRIQELRRSIEGIGREISVLEREVASKKEAMRVATEVYVVAEERLAQKRDTRDSFNKEMLDLILSSGKAKDEHLTKVLSSVPVVTVSADGR